MTVGLPCVSKEVSGDIWEGAPVVGAKSPGPAVAEPEGEASAPNGTIHIIWRGLRIEIYADYETTDKDDAWLDARLARCHIRTLPAPQDAGGVRLWIIDR